MMKQILTLMLLAGSSWGGVTCSNGTTWITALTCGATHPNTYTITTESRAALVVTVQNVLNDSQWGDTILFTAGQDFHMNNMILFKRYAGSGRLTIKGTQDASLPPDGTRITPAYFPLMPHFYLDDDAGPSVPMLIIVGGSANNDMPVDLRGIWFGPSNANNLWGTVDATYSVRSTFLKIGGGNSYSNNPATGLAQWWLIDSGGLTDKFSAPVVAGDLTIHVTDATRFLNGHHVWASHNIGGAPSPTLNNTTLAPSPKITAIDLGANTITIDRPFTASSGNGINIGFASGEFIHQELYELSQSINGITLRHCIFSNPGMKLMIANLAALGVRQNIVADSWFDTATGRSDFLNESHGLLYTAPSRSDQMSFVSNNYFEGGAIDLFFGGTYNNLGSVDGVGENYDIAYNFFGRRSLREHAGNWTELQGNASLFLRSDVSYPGLPALSPRLVLANHVVRAPVSIACNVSNCAGGATGKTLIARNTGVIGTSPPNWASLTTYGQEIYDGDPTRSGYGTTTCNDGPGNTAGTPHPGDGVCWRATNGSITLWQKNNFELKSAAKFRIHHNTFAYFTPDTTYNTIQANIVNLKAATLPGNAAACGTADGTIGGAANNIPLCYRPRLEDITLENNVFRDTYGGLLTTGSQYPGYGPDINHIPGRFLIRNNLFLMKDGTRGVDNVNNYAYKCFTHSASMNNAIRRAINFYGLRIENNTCYAEYTTNVEGQALIGQHGWQNGVDPPMDTVYGANFIGNNSFTGNILPRGPSGTFNDYAVSVNKVVINGTGGNYEGKHIVDWFPNTSGSYSPDATFGTWGKNILLGAAAKSLSTSLGAYPNLANGQASVWTGCGADPTSLVNNVDNATPCVTSSTAIPAWSKVYSSPGLDMRVKTGHWGQRAMPNGADVGVDARQLPAIKELTTTVTDRLVIIQYRLSDPIKDIPCVVEMVDRPDFDEGAYGGHFVGELSDIATYHGYDSDNHDRNIRDTNRRMIVIGHTVPLTANTWYWGRLHCGGDTRYFTINTLSTLTSTAAQKIQRTAATATVANMIVEYGTAYSRATDTISGGGTSSPASCTVGTNCIASITVTRGAAIYYRWKERNGSNTVIATGKVDIMPAL